MGESKNYVRVDENGVMRIAETRVMLDSVVAAFEQGHSPETIRQQYPALSLEEVYGALTYYLGHQQEVTDYLHRQGVVWDQWRSRTEGQRSPVVARLRALRAAPLPEGS
jgi:uncharacterized protein (DUF433 family)